MSIKEMLDVTFTNVTTDQWKQKAEESLKGKSIETLSRNTYENIKLKPLYSKEDERSTILSQYPGQADFRRGANPLGYASKPWKVAQIISASTVAEVKEKLASVFETGQLSIAFEVTEELLEGFVTIVEDSYQKYPFSLKLKNNQSSIIKQLSGLKQAETVTGFIAQDPIAIFAETGTVNPSMEANYDEWAQTIKLADEKIPNLQTILIDSTPYHNGGANAVQELAISLSTGVYHIQELLKRGLSIETVLSKMVFEFSIGANFFMEIAKLRAARILWSKVAEAYGVGENYRGMTISAKTSYFTKTVLDPYVNMLRAGNEAFAAVVGGVQYLHVSPFNEPEGSATPFSDRIARNTQLILREEAQLTKSADPSGGSWYVEHLTNELAEKAWEQFLLIDEKDGIYEVLKTNWLQEQIKSVKEKRKEAISTRKQSIIGTNIYANLNDKPLTADNSDKISEGSNEIQPIPQERLSHLYEGLRFQSEELKNKNVRTDAGLLCLGSLKHHKARADFITGFLAPGGIAVVNSGELNSVEQANSFIKETKLSHYFLCGTNDQYKEIGLEYLKTIKEAYPEIKIFLAGLPEQSEQNDWLENGISEFIHVRSNCYETLSSLLKDMEVANHD